MSEPKLPDRIYDRVRRGVYGIKHARGTFERNGLTPDEPRLLACAQEGFPSLIAKAYSDVSFPTQTMEKEIHGEEFHVDQHKNVAIKSAIGSITAASAELGKTVEVNASLLEKNWRACVTRLEDMFYDEIGIFRGPDDVRELVKKNLVEPLTKLV